MGAPPRATVLALYREMMRASRTFSNYNFREYALRHVRDDFRANKPLTGDDALRAYQQGRHQLGVLHRTSAVSAMFPQEKHAME